jgi:uncharacterized protein (UPF0248 family)
MQPLPKRDCTSNSRGSHETAPTQTCCSSPCRGEFTIGYFDRLEERIIVVPLVEVRFDPDDHFSFQLNDAAGEPLSIPLHRVCEVYRNGELIWHRGKGMSESLT